MLRTTEIIYDLAEIISQEIFTWPHTRDANIISLLKNQSIDLASNPFSFDAQVTEGGLWQLNLTISRPPRMGRYIVHRNGQMGVVLAEVNGSLIEDRSGKLPAVIVRQLDRSPGIPIQFIGFPLPII